MVHRLIETTDELPFPKRTLVEDVTTGRVGLLMAGLIERDKRNDRITRRVAFVRPRGGGYEWTTDFDNLKPVSGS
ncbi:hypothetical protein [Streptomyces millisiae]|uniref:Uncharacterized protein n=1 Tax=Streptomyces millisiae TaxID=3075542 RepID=A0ABU2LJF8_9ACTN|nr:hypothetical protein [Streptomyces sp. DSM 44918]MDT0317721.1 hypothetical protein [Streptomyces sp. DSM 44918]